MEVKKTERGFNYVEFKDRYGENCIIQKSSLAFEDAIWFGVNNGNHRIMTNEGWKDWEKPKEVLLSDRMHLTQDQVKEILPILDKFAKTGEI